jgi:hypothetical protein
MQPQSVPDRLARLEERVSQLEGSAIPQLRAEMHQRFEALERRVEQGFEDARRHSLVLYEDLVTRISTIGEALAPAPGRPRRKR